MYAKHLYINGEEVTSVTIPSSVTHINQYAFSGCQDLETLIIESDALMNQEFSSSLNIGTIFHCGINNLIIGDGITQIPQYAFYSGANAASITFSSTLKAIGNYAFQGHSALSSITIPSSVNSIGEYAFSGCNGLTDVTIPSSVNSIGVNAFDKCTELTTVTIESNEVMNLEFNYSYNLGKIFGAQVENYIIGNGVNQISSSAFYSCDAMSSVSISSSVTSIESGAFYGNNHLTKAEFASIESLCNIDFGSYTSNPLCYAKHLYINGIEQTSVVIPSSVTRIGNGAFFGYSGLIAISSTSSIESIGNYAFFACNGLTELPYLSSLTIIGEHAFDSCSGLTSVALPASLVSLGEYAFYGCSALKNVTIDSNTLMTQNYSRESNFKTIFGEQVANYIISDKVKQIPNYAFSGCEAMTSVTLPSSVNSIGDYAFYRCSGLTSITIPSSVNSIGNDAFYYCDGLTSIDIPASVTSIGEYAFYDCSNLSKAEFVSIERLCSIKFENSSSNPLYSAHHLYIDGEKQTSVTIPSSVVSIGNYAFINCEDMISISIPSSVTSIGESAFEGCLGLTKAEFASIESLCNIKFDRMGASNPLSYAHHLFINGSEQTSVNIPSSVTNIGDYTFLGCSGLTSVTIPSSVTSIGIAAFAGCTGLTSITIPPSVNFINGAAFAGTGIASIVIPESVTDLVGELFANCHNLASVTLPSTMQGIGSGNFRDCPNLKLITIKATTPPTIYASGTEAFPNYDITLCVPYNCRYIYAQTSPWNNFWDIKELTCEHSFTSTDNHDGTHNNSCSICGTVEIVAHDVVNGICVNCGATPDTDITDIANTIYFDNCNAFCGKTIELPIKMKNDIAATGFQFDIILPEGITAVQDEDGFYDITLSTERTTATKTNTFDSSLMSDGSIRVLAASTRNYAFSGNDGEVCKIKLNVSEDLPAGDYPIILKNIELTNAQGKTWNVERLKRTITVKDYQLGDANGDGRVSVGDFSAIANHILGSTPEGFNLGAADANQDNNISVGDLSTVATMILTEEAGGASMAKAKARRSAEVSDPNNYIYADPVVISEDGDATIVFNMKNEIAATGFQFNFTLPEGFTVTEDEDGFLDVFLSQRRTTSRKTNTFDCVKWSDGSYRVLAASTKNYEFTGNDGEVVTVHIKKNDDVESGNYALVLTDIELTNAQGATFRTSRSSYTITVPSNSNEVELVDGETYDNPTTATYDKVTFTKTFSTSQANKWNALYVPMSINVEDYAGELDFAELYAFCATEDTNHDGNVDADDENYLLVHPVKAGNIKPNVPYLVRPHEAKTYTINSADNVLYGATAGKVEFATALDKFTVTGLNEAFTVTAGDNNYYVSSTGSLDYRETGSTTVKANRWVMHRESKEYGSDNGSASQGKSYKIIAIGEDMGEATAIELIKMSNGVVLDNSDVYTIDGRKVNADHKLVNGIYIKGGKKFVVK